MKLQAEPLTAATLVSVMGRAPRGTMAIYHTGLLMRDRQHAPAVNEIAAAAWALYQHGEALLFQRRISGGDCDYLIVKV